MEKRQNSSLARSTADGHEGDVLLEIFDPTGSLEVTQLHAPRLADLNGKTICELGNAKWEDDRIFKVVRELLTKRYPKIKIIPYTEFPYGYEIDDDQVAAMVKEKGGQGVILASGA